MLLTSSVDAVVFQISHNSYMFCCLLSIVHYRPFHTTVNFSVNTHKAPLDTILKKRKKKKNTDNTQLRDFELSLLLWIYYTDLAIEVLFTVIATLVFEIDNMVIWSSILQSLNHIWYCI